jgi:C1A family cysteine protease
MKVLLFVLLVTAAQASWPSKEGVALECGTILDLNEFEEPEAAFTSIKGSTGPCYFLITAPEGFHVELRCEGAPATANGQDASNFRGEQPVKVKFTPDNEDSQIFCRIGTEEEHADYGALQGDDGSDTNIKQFDMAFDVHGESEGFRGPILAANEKMIKEINADPMRTWDAGVTSMADKTIEEVTKRYTGLAPPPSQEEQDMETERTEKELLAPLRESRARLPKWVDLTSTGAVSPAKKQGSCGSCASFTTVSTVETCMFKETGKLPRDLSEQELLDCAFHYKRNTMGCKGAWPKDYMEWMYRRHNGGLATERRYPYISANWGMVDRAGTCRKNKVPNAKTGAKVTRHYQTWRATEDDIMRILAQGRAVASSIKVEDNFHLFRNRVYQNSKCQNYRTNLNHTDNRDHAITIVGYGTQNGVKYWKIKNSWGTGWGKNGFMKILRGKGHCGIAMEFSVPYCKAV